MGNFELVKLGDICEFISGGTPSRNNPSYFQGNIPWITGADITVDVITSAREYITQEAIESSATKIVPKGNILLVTRTGVGKVAIAGVDICISQDFTGLLPNCRQVETSYLFRLLQASENYFKEHQRGATIQGVTRSVVKDLAIPLPPLAEQKRIAAILDQADALRVKRRAALARLDRLVQAVFLEMFGDPVTNPMGWEETTLGDVSQVKGGLQVSSKRTGNPIEVPYLRVANVYRDRLDLCEIKRIEVTESELNRTLLSKGDILLVEGHGNADEIGRSAVWDGSIDPCVHQNHLIRVQADLKTMHPIYVSMYLNSEGGRRQLIRSGKTTSGLNTISASQVRSTIMLTPPLHLQHEFIHRIQKIHQLIENHQSSYTKFDRLFSSLQQRAFRGEL